MQTEQKEKCAYVTPTVLMAALALEGLVAESQGDEASSRRKQAPTQSDSNSSSSQYDTLGRYVSADGSRKKLWED